MLEELPMVSITSALAYDQCIPQKRKINTKTFCMPQISTSVNIEVVKKKKLSAVLQEQFIRNLQKLGNSDLPSIALSLQYHILFKAEQEMPKATV